MDQNKQTKDLIVIGGGIMGLMTAYYASAYVKNVAILEKSTIGNMEAASFSFTRSIRTDYLEPFYARLAFEAQGMWMDLQLESSEKLFINCGCLNIAKKSVTPDLLQTYAERSYQNISNLNYLPERFDQPEFSKRFPQFEADMGTLDTKGGYLLPQVITELMLRLLKQNGVTILENIDVISIEETQDQVSIVTNNGNMKTRKLVISAGKGTNDVISNVVNNDLVFPITYDRPQRKYYYPTEDIFDQFLPENFPVFAYTDIGIYGHPIFDKKKGAVKVAYFVPVGMKKDDQKIKNVEDFVNECLPILKNVRSEEVTDADMCWYDTVADDDFILGNLPGYKNIIVGTGWRGTGYKFAPIVGKMMAQSAMQSGTVYSISKFSPGRFISYEKNP